MSERIWFVVGEDRRRHGPMTSAELAQFARGGNAGPRSWAWRDGLDLWIPLAEAIGGQAHTAPTPPPTPTERPKPPHKPEAKARASSAANAAARQAESLIRHAREDAEAAVRVRAAEARQVAATKAQAAISTAQQRAMTEARLGCRKVVRFFGLALASVMALGVLVSQFPEAADALLDEIGPDDRSIDKEPPSNASGEAPGPSTGLDTYATVRAAVSPYLEAITTFRRETDRCPESVGDLGVASRDSEVLAAIALLETPAGDCVLRMKIGPAIPDARGQRVWWQMDAAQQWACQTDLHAPTLPPCEAGADPTLGTTL